ncbi:WYL domain-containing protein [Streptomyces sp. NPDC000927]|uniref:WYL domain-containing protein n=1 Tax=Streptomyces sp. NPDC000927 TaxID=3154371 RepID=UPI0033329CFF
MSLKRRKTLLDNAATALRPVEITYAKPDGEIETRIIEIDEIRANKKTGALYIRAYCRLRNDVRNFSLSGILSHRTLRTVGYQALEV